MEIIGESRRTSESTPPASVSGLYYETVLRNMHEILRPRNYFEIGTQKGSTLALSRCDSIAIDPQFQVARNIMINKPSLSLFQMTSDSFFEKHNPRDIFGSPIEFAFLDGMHLFEFLLRDFINTEKFCREKSVVVLHDCLPSDSHMARRIHHDDTLIDKSTKPGWWTGDVWKMIPCLRRYRPDLKVIVLDSAPTGLVIITKLASASTILADKYWDIIEEYRGVDLEQFGLQRLHGEAQVMEASDFVGLENISDYLII